MEEHTEVSMEYVKEILLEKNVKPSLHRINVLKYIIENKNHPSVDVIYKSLVKSIPTLSKTTVYNTLKLLSEKRIISTLQIDEAELRYDYMLDPHAHLTCVKCKKIFDIEFPPEYFSKNNINGFEVLEAQINLKGICKDCSM